MTTLDIVEIIVTEGEVPVLDVSLPSAVTPTVTIDTDATAETVAVILPPVASVSVAKVPSVTVDAAMPMVGTVGAMMAPASATVIPLDVPIDPTVHIPVIAGPPGPPGPQGPPGDPGGGAFKFTQGFAANPWIIDHPLGYQPNVTVVDSSYDQVEADVEYTGTTRVTLRFSAAFAGEAYLS